jgi:hypothetical protein
LDFESPSTGLKFPGVAFESVEVLRGEVGSSTGMKLRTAPSGTNSAFSSGAKLVFSIPVVRATMLVSPPFISVSPRRVDRYHTVRLSAYGDDGQLLTTASAPTPSGAAEPEFLANFSPTLISIGANVPIAQLTIDVGEAGEPFTTDGATFFFDDLTLTLQEQVPLVGPTLHIERRGAKGIWVSWDIPSTQLEQSPDLSAPIWQPVPVAGHGVLLDATTNASMFFRAVRPTQ